MFQTGLLIAIPLFKVVLIHLRIIFDLGYAVYYFVVCTCDLQILFFLIGYLLMLSMS